jgi:hypothetical protein
LNTAINAVARRGLSDAARKQANMLKTLKAKRRKATRSSGNILADLFPDADELDLIKLQAALLIGKAINKYGLSQRADCCRDQASLQPHLARPKPLPLRWSEVSREIARLLTQSTSSTSGRLTLAGSQRT